VPTCRGGEAVNEGNAKPVSPSGEWEQLGAFFAVKPQKTGLCGGSDANQGRSAPLQSLARLALAVDPSMEFA
jgi:hypothetical protein